MTFSERLILREQDRARREGERIRLAVEEKQRYQQQRITEMLMIAGMTQAEVDQLGWVIFTGGNKVALIEDNYYVGLVAGETEDHESIEVQGLCHYPGCAIAIYGWRVLHAPDEISHYFYDISKLDMPFCAEHRAV